MNEHDVQKLLRGFPIVSQHCTVTPTVVRGEHWLIVKNTINAGHVRLQRELWPALCELDGSIELQQWLTDHSKTFGDQRLLAAIFQLQRQGMLKTAVCSATQSSVISQLFTRHNPLMIRCALINPTRFLNWLCRVSSSVPSKFVWCLYISIVGVAAALLFANWMLIVDHWQNTGLRSGVWHFFLLYPLCKALHELAHGWMLQRYGGQVPEAGVSFIVLFPLPYVDATDAWTLPRARRMLVTAAGMMMDILVASVAIVCWVVLSTGVLADMAFSVALISLLSVFAFNANPLLKFDGYYLLEDALDSPGLARRSVLLYQCLFKRYILRLKGVTEPVIASGEKTWLLIYGLLSPCYRVFISLLICFYLITTFHELGVILSVFSIAPLFVLPLIRAWRYFQHSTELAGQRLSAAALTVICCLLVACVLFTLPLPSSTRTQGVVWVEEQAQIYASTSGELLEVLVSNGESVDKDQIIMRLADDNLELDLARKHSAVNIAKLELAQYRQSNPALALSAAISLKQARAEANHVKQQIDKLMVRSPESGRIAISDEYTLAGQRVSQGDLLAYVVNSDGRRIRAVMDQSALGKVSENVGDIHVRLASALSQRLAASIVQQVPAGTRELPSPALMNTGFGGVDVEAAVGEEQVQTREQIFHLELAIEDQSGAIQLAPVGTRAFVTLEHPDEPLARRWVRLGRQLLLKHLSV